MPELRYCTCCKEYKPLSEFYADRTTERRGHYLASHCKQCSKEIIKKYYRANKLELIEFMGGECAYCGLKPKDVDGCFAVFVVDEIKPLGHVIPKKKFTNLTKNNLAFAMALFLEGRTQLLCQNCSAIKTWKNDEFRNSRAITY